MAKKTKAVKRRKRVRDPFGSDPFGRFVRGFARYMDSIGWSVLVAGNPRIQHQPGDRPMNHEFVLRFTGLEKKQPRKKQEGSPR